MPVSSKTHSDSNFQRALDDLDHRLGACDGLLAALTLCRNENHKANDCALEARSFYKCNANKMQRYEAMRVSCKEHSNAFDSCMMANSSQPEACHSLLSRFVACAETSGVLR